MVRSSIIDQSPSILTIITYMVRSSIIDQSPSILTIITYMVRSQLLTNPHQALRKSCAKLHQWKNTAKQMNALKYKSRFKHA